MNILCITPIKHVLNAYENLSLCGEVIYAPTISKDALTAKLHSDESIKVIFTNPNQQTFVLNADILAHSGVSVICTASTGTNHIDIAYCKAHSIQVIALTTEFEIINKITSTAEMAFALTLAIIRNVISANQEALQGNWSYQRHIGRQLDHLTVGIVGYGRLGKHYARFCRPFFKEILVSDPYVENTGDYLSIGLGDLIERADVISLHVHLNNETKHMINKESLLFAKRKPYIINTSRGDIVNEQDIIQSLDEGLISGYATDVLSDELSESVNVSQMVQAAKSGKNVIITPHIAGMTVEAQEIAYNGVINKLFKLGTI